MRIDCQAYRQMTCRKCNRYALSQPDTSKLQLGMCQASRSDIYECARSGVMRKEAAPKQAKKVAPPHCYVYYGKDLGACSTQENEGCGRCSLAVTIEEVPPCKP